jgi:hypothetical protein
MSAQVSLVAQALVPLDSVWSGADSTRPEGYGIGVSRVTDDSCKGLWYDKLNQSDVVERRCTFLASLYELLLKEQVFCKDTDIDRVRLMSQESKYNYNRFMRTDCYGGGTTYMDAARANRFVRVHNDNINNPAFRVSVHAVDDADICSEKECVWQCVLEVVDWWQTRRPGKSGQSVLAAESLRTVPGYSFMVGGGPLLHVLIALYYAFFRKDSLGKFTDLAMESYGTKKLQSVTLTDPSKAVAGGEDARVQEVTRKLEESLDDVAPMQMKRLKSFLDKHYGMLEGYGCDLVWGVGCTLQCTADNGRSVWPVIQCGDVPWRDLLDEGDPTKFFAETATVQGSKKLFPFVPMQMKEVVTWPIYAVLPVCMQPTTFTAKGAWDTVLGGRKGTTELLSGVIRRCQQYNVSARFAAGECGLQRKTTASLSEVPGQVAHENEVSLNLAVLRDRVTKFKDMTKAHLATVSKHRGGWARVEIAVAVPSMRVDDATAVSDAFRGAVHDAIVLAQENTAAYDLDTWTSMIEFFVSALPSRVRCTVDMMAPVPREAREDVLRQDELADYTLEVVDMIKRFYNGVGCMRSKVRSLPRCAYMYDRAVLGRMRRYGREERNKYTSFGGTDWLEKFYAKLAMSKTDAISIPDYVPAARHRRLDQRVEGMACPCCWNLYRPKDSYIFKNHPCQGRYMGWVPINGERFKRHHAEAVEKLTDEQKLVIELLDDPALNPNIFLGGGGGVGKSFAVRVAIEHICLKYGMSALAVIAPTHIAAQNVGGRTIHSFLGLTHTDSLAPKDDSEVDRVVTNFVKRKEKDAKDLQNNLRFIVVEEVGMLAAKSLGLLEYFLRSLKRTGLEGEEVGNFGDVKVLLVGDPLQLPPVELESGGGYFFQSEAFTATESRFLVLYLKKMFRTPYLQFVNFQARSRLGRQFMAMEHIAYANQAFGTQVDALCAGWLEVMSKALHKQFNDEELTVREMDAKLRFFYCRKDRMTGKADRLAERGWTRDTESPGSTTGDDEIPPGQMPYTMCVEKVEGVVLDELYKKAFPRHICKELVARDEGGTVPEYAKLPKVLFLAAGMRVKVLTNDHAPMVASNSVADVVSAEDDRVTISVPQQRGPAVEVEIAAVRESFEVAKKTVSRVQFPLRPCGSGTTYQVQGQTLHRRCCVYSNERIKYGDHGQAYTVISRHTDPAYIKALHDWDENDFRASEVVIRFDQYHAQSENCVSPVTYSFPAGAKSAGRVLACHLLQSKNERCPCTMCCSRQELVRRTERALQIAEKERAQAAEQEATKAEREDGTPEEGNIAASSTSDGGDGSEVRNDSHTTKKRVLQGTNTVAAGRRKRVKPLLPTESLDAPICCVGSLQIPKRVIPEVKDGNQRSRTSYTFPDLMWITNAYAALRSSEAEKQTRKERRDLMRLMLKEQGETLAGPLSESEQLYYLWNEKFNWGVSERTKRKPLPLEALQNKIQNMRKTNAGEVEAVVLTPASEVHPGYVDIYVTKSNRVYVFEEDQGQTHCLSNYIVHDNE